MILPLYSALANPPPGVLCLTLEPPAQEGYGALEANPEEGPEDDHRAGAPLLQRQAERAGVVQHGEEKGHLLQGHLTVAFHYLKGSYRKAREGLLIREWSNRTRENVFKLKEGSFIFNI